ncbi:SPFH domain-containing protein [Dactylosporangium sp. NPDC051485]|uniref:SPFH domain-containing protein n=1 Tax=Dactylosporangium sp. NPDC051485 TaxID=3154846 RepID=UPI003434C55E
MSNPNTYLDQVVKQQERLEADLRSKRAAAPASAPGPLPRQQAAGGGGGRGRGAGEQPAPNAVEVRVTGFGRWKTVLVPPNAFVVHTRRGRDEPLHVGLGVSFRYNPATDSYLVVPGAMQTILINAYCICRELQGVLVQAYVQWIIEDFATAYRRLDFGDAEDPMRLVNLQLKEQAEAAIKDKVSTMGVADVLSDKQPIIEELTARLRAVAEGSGSADAGLGLRIVTVQIKEAVVSSQRLWENLQKPYRAEQGRIARLAELAAEDAIAERELTAGRQRESQRIESDRELADLRARNGALEFDREAAETLRRSQREQQDARALAELRDATNRHALALERELAAEEAEIGRLRIGRESELTRLAAEAELGLAEARGRAAHEEALLALERARLQAAIDNEQSPESLQARLIERLPEIVARLPKPDELRSVTIGGTDGTTVAGLIAELTTVVGALRPARGG